MTNMQTARDRWQTAKPMVIALAIGLVAGPLITSYMGWQVLRATARAELRESVTDQLATICVARAKAEVADADKLDWSARNVLAKKWALPAGAPLADLDIADACARKLAV